MVDLKKLKVGTYISDGTGWYLYDGEYGHYTVNNVIAWQPLPSPYKGE